MASARFLFFFVPQVRSELLLWVFKFGRILRVFKLLKFIDEARLLVRALRGSARTIGVFLFFGARAETRSRSRIASGGNKQVVSLRINIYIYIYILIVYRHYSLCYAGQLCRRAVASGKIPVLI